MEIRSRCIALKEVKYKDSRAIATTMAREIGRISFAVSDSQSKDSRRRRALMQPGSIFESLIDFRENRQLQTFRDISPALPAAALDPARQQVALFVADFLYCFLNDESSDPLLFDYVEDFLRQLALSRRSIASAPLAFVMGLLSIIGIAPDSSTYRPGYVFDMNDGIFRPVALHRNRTLSIEESALLPRLLRMRLRNSHLFVASRVDRNRRLDLALDYIAIHFPHFRAPRSLAILRTL